MLCEDVKAKMAAFLESALQAREMAMIEEHLNICPSCREQRGLYEKSWELLGLYPAIQADEVLTHRISRRVSAPPGILRYLGPVAAAAVILTAIILTFSSWDRPIFGPPEDQAVQVVDMGEEHQLLEMIDYLGLLEEEDPFKLFEDILESRG
jgi:predicted anti-sigma-YlaC factor YlaD